MTVVTLESSHGSNRRWIVWWVVRRCHNVIAGRRRSPIPERAEASFRLPATLHGHTNKLRPPFTVFGWEERQETGLTPAEWREFPRYALGILIHAVKQSLRVSGRFRVVLLPVFAGFPSETPEGLSGGADNGCYGKCWKTFPLDKKAFQEILQQTGFDGPELCT